MPPKGLLAIRSDIAPEVEPDYLGWMTREHAIERVGIDGFLSARIFRSRHAEFARFLILYELEHAAVVDSPAYLERLNNPTPWSVRMMPHLGNFIRGGGEIVGSWGTGCGAALTPFLIRSGADAISIESLEALSKQSGVVAIRLLQTDQDRTAVTTNERALRTGDQSFEKLLMIETLDEQSAIQATHSLPADLQQLLWHGTETPREPAYSFVFYLRRQMEIKASQL
jgi:hypothetical protein